MKHTKIHILPESAPPVSFLLWLFYLGQNLFRLGMGTERAQAVAVENETKKTFTYSGLKFEKKYIL